MKIDPVIEMSVPEPVTSVSEPATIHLVDEINEKKVPDVAENPITQLDEPQE